MATFEPILLKYADDPDQHRMDTYLRHGGYQALEKALREHTPEDVVGMVRSANLRGRGGAYFPTGVKWGFLPDDGNPRFLCANADESEPGTFANRAIMDNDPHQLIEGCLISAYACQINTVYIYIRGEFSFSYRRLEQALTEARERGYVGKNILGSGFDCEVWVHRGAGAYICGEETALLESLEGNRPQPRLRPPFPAVKGVFSLPTVINNVETISCVTHIVNNGADWFAGIGAPDAPGPKLYCLSGHVNRPGLYELPMGTPLRELIYEHGQGMREDRAVKAIIPGGASAQLLTADDLDVTLDPGAITAKGSILGTGGVMVMDETTCIVRANLNTVRFFANESCGKCTPCREGTRWMVDVLARIEGGGGRTEDVELLLDVCDKINGKSFCLLGDVATWGLSSGIQKFREDYDRHVTEKRCFAAVQPTMAA